MPETFYALPIGRGADCVVLNINTGKGMDVHIGPWVKALTFFSLFQSLFKRGKHYSFSLFVQFMSALVCFKRLVCSKSGEARGHVCVCVCVCECWFVCVCEIVCVCVCV